MVSLVLFPASQFYCLPQAPGPFQIAQSSDLVSKFRKSNLQSCNHVGKVSMVFGGVVLDPYSVELARASVAVQAKNRLVQEYGEISRY